MSPPQALMADLKELVDEMVRFRDARDWAQFHTPRNLAAALSIEAGELQETMLWKSDGEITRMLADPPVEKGLVRKSPTSRFIYFFWRTRQESIWLRPLGVSSLLMRRNIRSTELVELPQSTPNYPAPNPSGKRHEP